MDDLDRASKADVQKRVSPGSAGGWQGPERLHWHSLQTAVWVAVWAVVLRPLFWTSCLAGVGEDKAAHRQQPQPAPRHPGDGERRVSQGNPGAGAPGTTLRPSAACLLPSLALWWLKPELCGSEWSGRLRAHTRVGVRLSHGGWRAVAPGDGRQTLGNQSVGQAPCLGPSLCSS